jgi:hypothetical protein
VGSTSMKERRLGSLGWDTGFSELETVMAGLVPAIHDLSSAFQHVDARDI